MNINRHNYEEYFILYADKELGAQDRLLVEEFVSLHTDLQEELEQLLQFRFSPDPGISFQGKEDLLKINAATPVTLTHYGEWLLLYTDDELDGERKIMVEEFIRKNPSIGKELALLQRAKLVPEIISFDGKVSLYRNKEKKYSIPVRWWRVAAAAVLLLGIGLTTALVINRRSSGDGSIVKGSGHGNSSAIENPVPASVQKENNPGKELVVTDNAEHAITAAAKQNKNNRPEKTSIPPGNKRTPSEMHSSLINRQPILVKNNENEKPTNNLPKPINNPNLKDNNALNNSIAKTGPPNEINNPVLTNPPVTNQPSETSPTENPAIHFARLEEGGKNKNSRGFLRKLARTFEKRTNITATDEDRLLVAGLAFRLK